MTNEKIYENLVEAVRSYVNMTGYSEPEKLMNEFLTKTHEYAKSNISFFSAMAPLVIEARKKIDSKVTSRTTLSAISRIAKSAIKRGYAQGIFSYGEKFAICDGARYIIIQNDISSVPHVETPQNFEKVVKSMLVGGEKIILPEISELKAWISECKVSGVDNAYLLGEKVWINPNYLIDMMQALPGCNAYYTGAKSPILFKSESGDGLCLPLNRPIPKKETATEAA